MLVTEAQLECGNRNTTRSVTAMLADRSYTERTEDTKTGTGNDHVTERTRDNELVNEIVLEMVHETDRTACETIPVNGAERLPIEKATSQPTRNGQRMTTTMIKDMEETATIAVVAETTVATAAVHGHKMRHQDV